MTYEAKVILDSIGPNGARLTTFELTYPRFVHAEFMTHRMFSRNSASSRAIPVSKLLERVENRPAEPVWWGKNQSGMQAREELDADKRELAKFIWGVAKNAAVGFTRTLDKIGLHKQLSNRLVEPWMDITVVCTATEYPNAWGLRVHPDAQPEFQRVMSLAYMELLKSTPRELKAGQWHLPYVTRFDEDSLREELPHALEQYACENVTEALKRISVGRCAAVSYLNQDKRDPEGDLGRMSKMRQAGHMSPFEHVAQALTKIEWQEHATESFKAWVDRRVPMGNLWGWRQYRKELLNEHDFSIEHPVQFSVF